MPDIILSTLNAKYIHASLGLRYLMANLGRLRSQAALIEFDIHHRPSDVAEALLAQNPRIVGLGVYIWNADETTRLVALLKQIRPDLFIILGGPEVSFETEGQPVVAMADCVITGEADLKFADVCRAMLENGRPPAKIMPAELPDFSQLALPYDEYTDEDIAHRMIYVEASRGCPFSCEFCLSSLDIPVRQAPLTAFLEAMQKLLDRGARQFKFVDRTFNLDLKTSRAILEFFLQRHQPGRFYHFEMIPDRFPESLRQLAAQFPPGSLQFEIGFQTFNPQVAARIQRRQNFERAEENLRFIRKHTGVHTHTDLIAGLPGEDLQSFAAGFDRLIALQPHEIQVGILKRLRGTPISRHTAEWKMVYNPHPPYDVLQTGLISFEDMQRLKRFARYWDLVGNSGNFIETITLFWEKAPGGSPFAAFWNFSNWLHARTGRTDSIALLRLVQFVFDYLTSVAGHEPQRVAETLWRDYRRGGRRDCPPFLQPYLSENRTQAPVEKAAPKLKRQQRHWS